MPSRYAYGSEPKYLFSIKVKSYNPNRQLSLIASHGGSPRSHYSTEKARGVVVALLDLNAADALEDEYQWVEAVHKGYYRVKNQFDGG